MNNQTGVGFHYTSNWRDITTGASYNKGLLPLHQIVVEFYVPGLPKEVYTQASFSFLNDPEPQSWTKNAEFPDVWRRLFGDIATSTGLVQLVNFPILVSDKAFVVDRAYVERLGKERTREEVLKGHLNYWNSKVPVQEYGGSYDLPELVLFSPVELERLTKLWEKNKEEVKLKFSK